MGFDAKRWSDLVDWRPLSLPWQLEDLRCWKYFPTFKAKRLNSSDEFLIVIIMGRREEVVEVAEGLPEVSPWFFQTLFFENFLFLFNSLSRWWWEEKKGWLCPKEVLISSQIKADKSKWKEDLNIDLTFSRPLQCFHHISRSGSLHPSSRRVDLNPEPQTSSTRGSHSQVKRLLIPSTRKASKISQVSRGSKSSKTSDKEKSDVEVRVVPDTLLVSISPDLVCAVIVKEHPWDHYLLFLRKSIKYRRKFALELETKVSILKLLFIEEGGEGGIAVQLNATWNLSIIDTFSFSFYILDVRAIIKFIVKVHPGLVRGAIPVLSHRFSFNIYLLKTKFF